MTINTNDIKINIINIITRMDDVDKLEEIYERLEKDKLSISEKPNIQDAIIELTEGVSYKDILKDQHYEPITYEEFRSMADEIEWEHSLEELLAALD